jgi:hypothetical protein
MHKLDPEQHLDCFILCLKMISGLLKHQQAQYEQSLGRAATKQEKFYGYSHNLIQMLDRCLNTLGPNVSHLIKSDKELYYSEVKHLIKIIKFNKE